jgi:PAS domain S-box-containing protein
LTSPHPDDHSSRVLILAPFGRDADLLARVLNQADIHAETRASVSDLCSSISAGVGSVLIAEEAITGDALAVLEECLRNQEPWSDLPIFVMNHQSEMEGRILLRNLLALGNVTLLERPLRSETLVSAFRMGLRARAHQYQLRARLDAERENAQALRESERRYRKLAESLPLLVWTTTGRGDCDYLSRQWVEFTGLSEEEQLGFGWLEVLHPDDRQHANESWQRAYENGAAYDLEYRIRRRDGVYRWFKTRGVPAKNSSGSIEKWFGSCTDIEDQKRISEERRELLVSEKKARGLAELLNRVGPMLLGELDTRRLAQKVTDMATQLTGAEFGALFHNVDGNGELHLQPYALCGAIPANMEIPAPVFQGAEARLSEDIGNDPRFEAYRNMPVRSYLAVPVLSRSGELMGGLLFGSGRPSVFGELHIQLAEGIAAQSAIAFDNARLFAEAQQAQETLKRSNFELRRANEDLNQFAYSASHDLQEPLRMVALYSQMMQRKYRHLLDGPGAEYLNYMVQGARRMEMLLRDLLDYTQVVSSEDTSSGAVDANLVFQGVVQNLSKSIEESAAIVTSEDLPLVAVKEVHMLQLLQNLISNALKYRGSSKPRIHISAQAEENMWRLSVRDNGIGISSQYTKQVFGLFKRLHGNSHYEGTGIGLAICQKIVERYGGRIWVESDGEGKGSNFIFTLPGAK